MIKKYSFPLLSIFVGIVVGFATIVGQKFFPGALNSLANSGSIWMIPAFYIAKSYRQKWKSILSSIFCLLVCVESLLWLLFDSLEHRFFHWIPSSNLALLCRNLRFSIWIGRKPVAIWKWKNTVSVQNHAASCFSSRRPNVTIPFATLLAHGKRDFYVAIYRRFAVFPNLQKRVEFEAVLYIITYHDRFRLFRVSNNLLFITILLYQ